MKKTIRNEIKAALRELPADDIGHKSKIIAARICTSKEFDEAETIMLYLPFAGEVQTLDIARRAWAEGKTICVPTSPTNRKMQPIIINDDEAFSHEHSLRSPVGKAVDISQINLIVVPALAYDKKCNRLGRGGGFYDRFLADDKLKAFLIGAAFCEQIRDILPIDKEDKPVDRVCTDTEIIERE